MSTDVAADGRRTFKLTLAYDGAAYQGWQRQPGRATIQERVEAAVCAVTGEQAAVHASGRTDAGVHALGQVAHVRARWRLPPETLLRALNANLPEDVAVRRAEEAPAAFHARRDARRKTYFYQVYVGPDRHPFWRRFALHLRRPPDVRAMRAAAAMLTGRRDFRSFVAHAGAREDTVRTLYFLRVLDARCGLRIFACADGFLQHMVRALAGTLLQVGAGRAPPAAVREILAARDRGAAPASLPPHGLFLWRVDY
ncbi:MAG: tRNA pseudouridine(38-40) synthase TruA [Planctomycetes bacterium]|nr:tRNA pseudouridine(38-40) synthase TruA [Planctomycetota bacterium]